jgi:hypothetical protein
MTNPLVRFKIGPRDKPTNEKPAYFFAGFFGFFFAFLGSGGVASIRRSTSSGDGCGFSLLMAGV